jgi:hypothetical protein
MQKMYVLVSKLAPWGLSNGRSSFRNRHLRQIRLKSRWKIKSKNVDFRSLEDFGSLEGGMK